MLRKLKWGAFLIILAGAYACEAKINNVMQILGDLVVKGKTPAVVYMHFDTEKVLYSFYAGKADVRQRKDLTPAHTFNMYSVTKTMTAVAILQLAEQGRLSLDAPVKKYMPSFPYGSAVTIRHLLTHTAGLPNPMPLKWVHTADAHSDFDANSYFDKVFADNKQLKAQPGERMRYSNLGYLVLGRVIEAVTGQRYEDYISSHILRRIAGKDELSFTINPHMHARGYQPYYSFMNIVLGLLIDKRQLMLPREGSWKPFRYHYVNGAAYGGLIANADGMVKYGQALLNDRLLTAAGRQQLFAAHTLNNGSEAGMSLSWFTGMLNGVPYRHHAGGGGGYYVELRLYPDKRRGSILIQNRTGIKDEKLLDKIDATLL